MRDEEDHTFHDYILSKKLRLLHFLYERLYSFAEYSNCTHLNIWRKHLGDNEENCALELRGTELFSIDLRLKLHSFCYKKLKPRPSESVILGPNGQHYFFKELEDVNTTTNCLL